MQIETARVPIHRRVQSGWVISPKAIVEEFFCRKISLLETHLVETLSTKFHTWRNIFEGGYPDDDICRV